MLHSTWCLALLGAVLNLGFAQPGYCRPIWRGDLETQTPQRNKASIKDRLDPHTGYALQATVAAYTLLHGELPTTVDQLMPLLLFNYLFTQRHLDIFIQQQYTSQSENAALSVLAFQEAGPFRDAFSTAFHHDRPSPQEPEFLLSLQVGLLSNAMMAHQQRHGSAPNSMDALAASWGGYNEAGWINPYTGESMLRVQTSVARTTEHAGDYAETNRDDRLRILLYRKDEGGLSQPVLIKLIGPPGHSMLVITENRPDWELSPDFY